MKTEDKPKKICTNHISEKEPVIRVQKKTIILDF